MSSENKASAKGEPETIPEAATRTASQAAPQAPTEATPQLYPTPVLVALGPDSMQMKCPSCGANIVTKIRAYPNIWTHAFAVLLFLFICWLCSCVPYFIRGCQDVKHYCPSCNAYLGIYKRQFLK